MCSREAAVPLQPPPALTLWLNTLTYFAQVHRGTAADEAYWSKKKSSHRLNGGGRRVKLESYSRPVDAGRVGGLLGAVLAAISSFRKKGIGQSLHVGNTQESPV